MLRDNESEEARRIEGMEEAANTRGRKQKSWENSKGGGRR